VANAGSPRADASRFDIDRVLLFSIFGVLILTLSLGVYLLWTGFFSPAVPRTAEERVIANLQSVVAGSPKITSSRVDLIEAYLSVGELDKAQATIDAVSGTRPAAIVLEQARLEHARGDDAKADLTAKQAFDAEVARQVAEAKKYAEKGISMSPELQDRTVVLGAVMLRGSIAAAKKDYAGAFAMYDKAVKIAPTDSGALTSRGMAALESDKAAQAKADFDKALSLDPQNAVAVNGLARIAKAGAK